MKNIIALLILVFLLLSGINPADRLTWFLETMWVIPALILYFAYFRKKEITTLLFCLLAIHCVILIVGGYYTYEKVPLGEWMKDIFGFTRNNYDRIGHLAQGFVPAILFREILLRNKVIADKRVWQIIVIFMMCMGFSAIFELVEWLSAVTLGNASLAFLGSQGDVWDAQGDMFCCGIGALASLLTLSNLHDHSLAASGEGCA